MYEPSILGNLLDSKRQAQEQKQRRIAMFTMGWSGFMALFFGIRALVVDIPERFYPLTLVAIACFLNVYYLRKGGQKQISAVIFIFVLATGIAIAIYTNGGIQSVAATWVLVIPFLAGLTGKFKTILLGIFLSLTILVVLLVVDLFFGGTPDLTPLDQQYNQNRFHQFGQLITICICFTYFLYRVRNHQKALNFEIEHRLIAEKNAKKANAAKSQFLANMSHEIRTPLNGIVGLLPILKNTGLNDEQDRLVGMMELSSQNLLAQVNDILDISKIETGKLELSLTTEKIQDVLARIEKYYQAQCDNKGISFHCLYPDEPIWLELDATRFKQLLENLLSNAIKFTETGSVSLNVSIENIDQKKVRLYGKVKDTGIGMTEEQQSRVFETFAQADGSTTRNYGGSGLGLTISRELLHLMGGEIEVRSKLTEGSQFSFSIPLDRAQQEKST